VTHDLNPTIYVLHTRAVVQGQPVTEKNIYHSQYSIRSDNVSTCACVSPINHGGIDELLAVEFTRGAPITGNDIGSRQGHLVPVHFSNRALLDFLCENIPPLINPVAATTRDARTLQGSVALQARRHRRKQRLRLQQ